MGTNRKKSPPLTSQKVVEMVILSIGMVYYLTVAASPLNQYILAMALLVFYLPIITKELTWFQKLIVVAGAIVIAMILMIRGTFANPTVIGGFESEADPAHNASVMAQNFSIILIFPVTMVIAKLIPPLVTNLLTGGKSSTNSGSSQSTSNNKNTTQDSTKSTPDMDKNSEGNTVVFGENKNSDTKIYEQGDPGTETKVYENED